MGCGSGPAMTQCRVGKKDANFSGKHLTSRYLSGIVRALAARYGFPVSGRAFEYRVVNITVILKYRPLQRELQAF